MKQYIVFENYDQKFALNIICVEKIIEYIIPKKIPESSEFFLGVINYNDNILPIINLTKRLYGVEDDSDDQYKIVIVFWNGKLIGLVVNRILGIENFSEEQYEESGDITQISKEYIDGFIKSGNEIIIVLDITKLFTVEQEEELLSAVSEK